ncbi:MAG: endolytic transglycosylase MltG [Pseudobdellovibrionaceae bacterium]|nr:endolytic transglycosylase MltG [Bdellovibrionales bacterium]USN46921.1 MAG: endolytic transglycosylase MltG [Pseudobdellovibrionaceae bacterium]
MRKVFLAVVLILILSLATLTWQAFQFWYSSPSQESERVVFEVPPGASFRRVAEDLEHKGLVGSAKKLTIMARLTGFTTKTRMGEYALDRTMRPIEILEIISSGKSIGYSFTVPEGTNMYEVARLLADQGLGDADEFLRLCQSKPLIRELLREDLPNLEGYLFPETYQMTKFTEEETLVRTMVQNFLKVYEELPHRETSLTRHQVVTLASVVEKETGAPEERPLIASVFHNRLKKSMRLQSDPTILYGILAETGEMKKNITKKDILTYNKYNTYRVNALPFGPISNPGRAALEATLRPATSEFLYFVSRNEGTHVFTKTYEDHQRMVRKFQLDPSMREGKSWRDRTAQ